MAPAESSSPVTAPGRFAFVTLGPFSGINKSVLDGICAEFPSLVVEHVDVRDWIRSHRGVLAANLLVVLAGHGPRTLLDRTRLWGAFYRTPFIQRAIRREMARRLGGADRFRFRFSLQTQSLFDASVDGVPHFVYTDHTELVNLRYPGSDGASVRSGSWITRERRIYAHARVIFTMSRHVSRSLAEQYGIATERIRCVGAGSNVPVAGGPPRDPAYESRRILFVGRDWERKGGPQLVAAFRRVRQTLPSASLVIVGCSPDLAEPGVTVAGEQPSDAVEAQYLAAAVFCMPTRIEPFGIVFVEALTHGLPVVATDVGAVPDIVQDGSSGYLHGPDDVEGLAASLCGLLADPGRCRAMGRAGQAFVRDSYTWAGTTAAMAGSIRAVIGDPVGQGG